MRRDTQIGIILGIVILVIIGVFLSTRTNVNEPQISELVISESVTRPHEIEEININTLIEETEADQSNKTESIENTTAEPESEEEEFVKSIPLEKQSNEPFVDTSSDNTSLKGKWEGIPETKLEGNQIVDESPYEEAEEEILSEEKEHVTLVDTSIKLIYKVKPNDSLIKIAKEYYGDETFWDKIFEANKDNMSSPHSLYVGQELRIPDVKAKKIKAQTFRPAVEKKSEHNVAVKAITHTVQSGDTLYRIAGKFYNNPAMWKKIYEANKETIEDKGLLRKGQILVIPQ